MIGEAVRVTRIANDMTKKELAKKAKISISYLHEIETNIKKNLSCDMLKKISAACHITASELLEFNEYHDFLLEEKSKNESLEMKEFYDLFIGEKEKLEIYQLLLLKILESYQETDKKEEKCHKLEVNNKKI